MRFAVLIDHLGGKRVYASGDKDHCLDALDRADFHGYDAELVSEEQSPELFKLLGV